jgi:predicted acylesterase/phospholipase RssA
MKTFNLGDTVKLLEDSPFIKAGSIGQIMDPPYDGGLIKENEYLGTISISVKFDNSDCLRFENIKQLFEEDYKFRTQYIDIDNLEIVEKYDNIRRH